MNLLHVVMTDGSRVAVVPINRDAAPGRSYDRTLVCRVALPANAVSNLEFSRFIAGHLRRRLCMASKTAPGARDSLGPLRWHPTGLRA
jgi:hypothetical protein